MTSGVGAAIRAIRKQAGMTQQQLADRIGLTRASVTNIELGKQNLTMSNINAIAKALGYVVKIRFARPETPIRDAAEVGENWQ